MDRLYIFSWKYEMRLTNYSYVNEFYISQNTQK